MSVHLNRQQNNDWNDAVTAVEEIAGNTDNESSSKPYLNAMANFVRDEPEIVVHLLSRA
jgi:hypothetical protein